MRDFIKVLAEHQFSASFSFTNARYTFDQLAEQMSPIELVGEPTNVRNARGINMSYLSISVNPEIVRYQEKTLDAVF